MNHKVKNTYYYNCHENYLNITYILTLKEIVTSVNKTKFIIYVGHRRLYNHGSPKIRIYFVVKTWVLKIVILHFTYKLNKQKREMPTNVRGMNGNK